jgi:hypothetical protein
MLEFLTPAHDRVATEARDCAQTLDAALSPLQRQQTDESSPVFLIKGDQHPIDRAMVFGHEAIRVLLADLTGTHMNQLS